MTFALYTNSVSAHQLPLAREIVKRVGADNFRYIYTGNTQGGAQDITSSEPWVVRGKVKGEGEGGERGKVKGEGEGEGRERGKGKGEGEGGEVGKWLETADVLLVGGLRPIDLLERRAAKGLKTFYMSERWFKPVTLKVLRLGERLIWLRLPGWVRMFHLGYARMARRFVRLMNDDSNFITLSIGPWAKKDFLRLGVRPDKMIDWGYFVEPSSPLHLYTAIPSPSPSPSSPLHLSSAENAPLKVLWVGRPIWWKRVDTIRKAVAQVPNATLDVFTNISLAQVREEMRRHDVYILASNALEGWGAALSEALAEGMIVLGTHEAGASAALLPSSNLFHAGDWRALARLLNDRSYVRTELPRDYTPEGAAARLLALPVVHSPGENINGL